MTIHFGLFEERVLHVEEHGAICIADAECYIRVVCEVAQSSDQPIVVYIDATQVTGFDPQAKLMLAASARTPNVLEYIVVTSNPDSHGHSKSLSRHSTRGNTRLFQTHDEAMLRTHALLAMH
ncbi:MAG: hypothetical protein AAFV33_14810 [Chloroflexota bacterium]